MSFNQSEEKAIAAWEQLAQQEKTIPSKKDASVAAGLAPSYINNNDNPQLRAYFDRRIKELTAQGYARRKYHRGEPPARSVGSRGKRSNPYSDRDLNLRDRVLTLLLHQGALPVSKIIACSGGCDRDLDRLINELISEGAIERVSRCPTRYGLTACMRKTA